MIESNTISNHESDAPSIPVRLRRLWLTLLLAVVLSAVEIDRPRRHYDPAPVVLLGSGGGVGPRRRRPYRAWYRQLSVER